MKYIYLFLLFILSSALKAQSTNISGIVNSYYQVDTLYTSNCRVYIDVSSSLGLSIGDEILIIQMQGAVIDTSNSVNFGNIRRYMNAGNFEFAIIKNIQGNRLELNSLLKKYFNSSDKVQIVKVAKYTNANVNTNVICTPWNGSTGGIIAIEATDTLTLNANIDASDRGFRGGNLYPNEPRICNDTRPYWSLNTGARGPKGESIFKYNTKYEAGINYIANGGGSGSANNSGAGGGSNAGQGGDGGSQTTDCSISSNNGLGALPFDYFGLDRVFMGGGGGAGQQDESMASAGMNGGGIVFIKSRYLKGNSFSIKANGGNQTNDAGNSVIADGAGAGGAGGLVVLDINNYINNINIEVQGGKGGDTRIEDPVICTGPGGGGGGGLIWHSGASLSPLVTTNVIGGNAGICINTLSPIGGTNYNALNGGDGYTKENFVTSINNYQHPEITLINNDTLVCAFDSVKLTAQYTALGESFTRWTPSNQIVYEIDNNASISPATPLQYYFTVTDSFGCYDIDSVFVDVLPLPISNLNDEYIIQLYDSIQLFPTINDSIYWSTNRFIDSIYSFSPVFTPPRSQLYRYYIIDSNNCVLYDSLLIKVKQCTNLGLANIFTPNGDGKNDFYHFKNILIDELINFQIFNRWGELVFETKSLSDQWDGSYKGRELPTDVYTYQIIGICYGARFEDSGNISLIR